MSVFLNKRLHCVMALLPAALLSVLVFAAAVLAQQARVSPQVHRLITQAEELIEQAREPQAIDLIQRFLYRNKPSPYEQSVLDRLLAVTYVNSGNDTKAIDFFQNVLAAAQLDEKLLRQTRHELAYLYLHQQDYAAAQTLLDAVIQNPSQALPQEAYLIAFIYFELEQAAAALVWSRRLLGLLPSRELAPRHYYDLIISIDLMNREYVHARGLLQQMIESYQHREVYWRQLIAVESELHNPAAALAWMELARAHGFLSKQRDLQQLARLYLQQGIPYKAARIAQSLSTEKQPVPEVDQLIAMAWWESREYDAAIPYLQRAAQASKDGELYLYLAHIYVDREEWSHADTAIHAGMRKGKLKNRSQAQLLRGIVRFNLGQTKSAEADFLQCLANKQTRQQAIQWLEFLGSPPPGGS